MYLSVSFLIIPSAPTITGTVVVFRCYIFSISISMSLYLIISVYFLINMLLSVGTDISITFVCLFACFYGISTFIGYLMPNQFLYK